MGAVCVTSLSDIIPCDRIPGARNQWREASTPTGNSSGKCHPFTTTCITSTYPESTGSISHGGTGSSRRRKKTIPTGKRTCRRGLLIIGGPLNGVHWTKGSVTFHIDASAISRGVTHDDIGGHFKDLGIDNRSIRDQVWMYHMAQSICSGRFVVGRLLNDGFTPFPSFKLSLSLMPEPKSMLCIDIQSSNDHMTPLGNLGTYCYEDSMNWNHLYCCDLWRVIAVIHFPFMLRTPNFSNIEKCKFEIF